MEFRFRIHLIASLRQLYQQKSACQIVITPYTIHMTYTEELEKQNEKLKVLLEEAEEHKDCVLEALAVLASGMGNVKQDKNKKDSDRLFYVRLAKSDTNDNVIKILYEMKKQLYNREGLKAEFELRLE